jgi:hypothetical protein
MSINGLLEVKRSKMGDDVDFIRALIGTFKIAANKDTAIANFKYLCQNLDQYELSEEEKQDFRKGIEEELEKLEVKKVTKLEVPVPGEELEVEKSVAEVLPTLEKLVEEGIYETLEEAIEEYKLSRERGLERGGGELSGPDAKLIEILVSFRTNPDGLAEALEEALPEERREFFADLIRKRLEESAELEAIDWAANVAEWQEGCEAAMGTPMYRTRYIKRFEDPKHPGRYMVLGICYSPRIKPHKSQWFCNVPIEDVERLERA